MNVSLYDIVEFSKIYKRIMDLELRLKNKFFQALQKTFTNEKMFYRLIPFLKQRFQGRYTKKTKKINRDVLMDLINSNKTQEAKLTKFINMAYLSDILSILTDDRLIYKNKIFEKNFYNTKVSFNDLKRYAMLLKKLRNNIMHFKINDYRRNKKDYLLALSYWEKQLMCNICFMHDLPKVKPYTKKILRLFASYMPDFFKLDDRIVCDMFDDLAFLNGKPVDKLPPLWSVVRGFYDLKREYRAKNLIE